MNFRKMTALTLPVAATLAFTGTVALATEAATTASPAATAATAKPAAKTEITPQHHQAIVGLPVISSDGQTVGQVLSVGPGTNSKSMSLSVKPVDDLGAKSEVKIPVDRAVIDGRTVQLMVNFADVKKFYVR